MFLSTIFLPSFKAWVKRLVVTHCHWKKQPALSGKSLPAAILPRVNYYIPYWIYCALISCAIFITILIFMKILHQNHYTYILLHNTRVNILTRTLIAVFQNAGYKTSQLDFRRVKESFLSSNCILTSQNDIPFWKIGHTW